MSGKPKVTRFKESVLSKYQIYNSIFLTLPFDKINKTGVLLPLFHETCSKGFKNGYDPSKIVEPMVPVSKIKIIPHKEKTQWELVAKYNIGKKIN